MWQRLEGCLKEKFTNLSCESILGLFDVSPPSKIENCVPSIFDLNHEISEFNFKCIDLCEGSIYLYGIKPCITTGPYLKGEGGYVYLSSILI